MKFSDTPDKLFGVKLPQDVRAKRQLKSLLYAAVINPACSVSALESILDNSGDLNTYRPFNECSISGNRYSMTGCATCLASHLYNWNLFIGELSSEDWNYIYKARPTIKAYVPFPGHDASFNVEVFKRSAQKDPFHRETLKKYKGMFGALSPDVLSCRWYKEYVSQFEVSKYFELDTPCFWDEREGDSNDVDWTLFYRLAAASFSSELHFSNDRGMLHLTIVVENLGIRNAKEVSTLCREQVHRLHQIYVAEQLEMDMLMATDERQEIFQSRFERYLQHRERMDVLRYFNQIFLHNF